MAILSKATRIIRTLVVYLDQFQKKMKFKRWQIDNYDRKWREDEEYVLCRRSLETEAVKISELHSMFIPLVWSIPSVFLTIVICSQNGVAMLKQQRVLDFCMICSTMIGVRRNLMKAHMRISIQESL